MENINIINKFRENKRDFAIIAGLEISIIAGTIFSII
jgi:hypothetical protein